MKNKLIMFVILIFIIGVVSIISLVSLVGIAGSIENNIEASVTVIGEGYTLSVTSNPVVGGSVTKNPEQASYSDGTEVELTAVAAQYYRFDSWSGDLSGNSNPVIVVMDNNKNIIANFVGPLGDSNGDCYIDYWDLFAFADAWHKGCGNNKYDPIMDFDGTCYIDHFDLFAFAGVWHTYVCEVTSELSEPAFINSQRIKKLFS